MMSRNQRMLAPVLMAAMAACGPQQDDIQSRPRPIILGQSCATEPPGALAVMFSATAQTVSGPVSAIQLSCAGTLIAPDVVLTAGHCVQIEESAQAAGLVLKDIKLYVSFEADLSMLQTQPQTAKLPADAVEVSWREHHPQFDVAKLIGKAPSKGLASLHDIGVLFLARPVTQVQPAVVISTAEAKQLAVNTGLRIVGWGRTSPLKPSPFAPPDGGKRICGESFINELGPWEMQVGGDNSTPRKCQGDSGGPSYAVVDGSHDRVVGVTSRAYDPTMDCAVGGIDTRVDPYRDWLDSLMREGCTTGKRAWCEVPGLIPAVVYDPTGPGLDAAPSSADAPAAGEGDGGGGCRTGGGARPGIPWLLLLVGMLALTRRRRAPE